MPLFLAVLLAAQLAQPVFSLRDTTGASHTASEWRDKPAVVLFFLMTDCPLSNGYVPEMNRIREAYPKAAVYGVLTDAVTAEEARSHVKDFAYGFPVLLDRRNELARFTKATTVPQAAVLSSSGEILYLGRIDNRVEDFGRARQVVTQHELRDALDEVLSGKIPRVARTKAVGCAISLETSR